MQYQKTVDTILRMRALDSKYAVITDDSNKFFWGKNIDENVVFMIKSDDPKIRSLVQETKDLSFCYNRKCTFSIGDYNETNVMHILTCKASDVEQIKAFVRLTQAFSATNVEGNQYFLSKLFSALTLLFIKEREVSETEIQGFFAELYVIKYFFDKGCDLAPFWQSVDRMKFDFSISDKKRLEIKSTLKPTRTHHFKHEQLLSEIYDIAVVSIKMQKNDQGMTLLSLVEAIQNAYSDNYALLAHIEKMISSLPRNTLENIKYDKSFIDANLQIYNAKDIPHFNEKSPEGVYNAEYDCVLEGIPHVSEEKFILSIKQIAGAMH